MSKLRSLRRSRALTYLDLATVSGVPARAIAEAELGLRALTGQQHNQLAFVFGVGTHALHESGVPSTFPGAREPRRQNPALHANSLLPALVALAIGGTVAAGATQNGLVGSINMPTLFAPTLASPPDPALNWPGAAVRSSLAALAAGGEALFERAALRAALSAPPAAPISPALMLAELPPPVPIPLPTKPSPNFYLSAYGPVGCPVQPPQGQVVLTQGYGVGSHAPAHIWGAVDLAVDSDGDGFAEPGASWYAPVVASHAGSVTVTLDSHPAGNHVWVRSSDSPWRTGYAHLAIISVLSGQFVQAGEVIGMIGSTGAASGPHLDYQVWNGEVNVDPTELVGCG